ncbi:MAG: THUMP domain-containing protein [Bacteroidetes bacterium]|nr:THUMP domain-containing protein [Bacteroidota bacterium]
MKEKIIYTAKTLAGMEELLQQELLAIGAENTQLLKRAVAFEGSKEVLYRGNYSCRTALRFLVPVKTFPITKQEDLYENIKTIPWEDYLEGSGTLAVDAVNSTSVFTNSQYVALKTKDAVVDRYRERTGNRPSINLDDPDLRINIHIYKETCNVSLDSSGSSLHKRGYRKVTGPAPLNEVLAAGLVQLSGWNKTVPLYDPMCGSGTILIEAAMLARNIPAGYFRPVFGFQRWKDFDEKLWDRVKAEENAKINDAAVTISGSDKASRAVATALENIAFAKLTDTIKVTAAAFEYTVPTSDPGVIICNPPYDERLQIDDIIGFYKQIGDVLKKNYKGYEAWIISSDLKALKFIGLHPSKKITVFNGPLECRFVRFSLY